MTIDDFERRNKTGDSAPAADTSSGGNDTAPKWDTFQSAWDNNAAQNNPAGGNDWNNNDWNNNQGGNDSAWDTSGTDDYSDYDTGNDQGNQNAQQQPENPQPQNEAERQAAAQAQNQYTQQALANLTGQQTTLEEEMKTVDRNDEAAMWALYQKYYDENGNPRAQAAPAQQSATAAVNAAFSGNQATTGQQAQQPATTNLRQIIDPNKDYGRTGVPGAKYNSYVYSYSAKELQNQLNREIMQHNRDIASGKIPGTAADYIKPLKEDGLMGYQTLTTMQKLGYDTSGVKGWTDYNAQRLQAQQTQPRSGADYLLESSTASQMNSPSQSGQNNPQLQAFYGSVLNSNGFVNGVPAQTNDAYMKEFQNQYEALHRQFPNYTFQALADIILENELQRNGNSAFYKWIAGQM